METETAAPGEKPRFLGVRENRWNLELSIYMEKIYGGWRVYTDEIYICEPSSLSKMTSSCSLDPGWPMLSFSSSSGSLHSCRPSLPRFPCRYHSYHDDPYDEDYDSDCDDHTFCSNVLIKRLKRLCHAWYCNSLRFYTVSSSSWCNQGSFLIL